MGILGELWVKLGLKSDEFTKGTQDAKRQASGLASYIQKLGGMIATAFSVKAIVQFTHQAAELSNKVKGVKTAFEKLADPNLLNNLRKATQGTVDDIQLMQRAVQAQNFGIPVKNLATYLEFATKRARETGQSVDYLVDSIITGLGRQSVLILDNLGISASEIRERMKEGGSMADAVGEIIKKSMSEGATEIDKAAVATERLQAAWVNFQTAVGTSTAPVWNWLKGQAADYLSTITTILNAEGFSGGEKLGMIFGGWNADKNRQKLIDQQAAKDKNTEQAQALAQERVAAIKSIQQAEEELFRIQEEGKKLAGKPEDNVFVMANKFALKYVQDYIVEAQKKKKLQDEENKKKAEEEKVRNSLIGGLELEIKKKEQIRDLSANAEEVQNLNNEIAEMRERLKVLKMTNEELLKYKNEQRAKKYGTIENVDGVKTPHIWDAPSIFKEGGRTSDKMFQKDMENWRKQNEEIAAIALEQQQKIQEGAEMMAQALNSGITAGLGELANLIAGVEGANPGQAVKALLSPLADAAISAGLLIMTTGEGIEALRDGLTSFLGVGAVAAGAALMAVGVAAKAGLAAIGKGGSGAGYANNPTTSYSGGYGVNTNNYAQATSSYTLTTTLKGQDLLLAIQRTENNNRR